MSTRKVLPLLVGAAFALASCGGGSDSSADSTTTSSVVPETVATVASTLPTPSTTPALTVEGATVVVANGNIVGGSAGRMTDALGVAGFTVGTAVNGTEKVDASIVYHRDDPAAKNVAASVALVLGGVSVELLPDPVPVEGEFTADVLLLLGNEQADQPLVSIGDTATGDSADSVGTIANSGSTVVVANASGIAGVAGKLTEELDAAGFTVGTATNAAAQVTGTTVYYATDATDAEAAQADAQAVADALGGVPVLEMPSEIPTETGSTEGDVLVILGPDVADKTLSELSG